MDEQQPFIIFLKGIVPEDYKNIEDKFNERLMENVSETDPYTMDKVRYNTISPIFTSVNSWKKTTNLHCWTCDFTFTTVPIFIPLNIKSVNNTEWNISVYGNFCSFSCAARQIIDFMSPDLHDNLLKLYEIFYNTKIHNISPTPRRHNMCKYGGYMSEESYLSNIKKLSINMIDNNDIQKEYLNTSINNDNDELLSSIDKEIVEDKLWNIP